MNARPVSLSWGVFGLIVGYYSLTQRKAAFSWASHATRHVLVCARLVVQNQHACVISDWRDRLLHRVPQAQGLWSYMNIFKRTSTLFADATRDGDRTDQNCAKQYYDRARLVWWIIVEIHQTLVFCWSLEWTKPIITCVSCMLNCQFSSFSTKLCKIHWLKKKKKKNQY